MTFGTKEKDVNNEIEFKEFLIENVDNQILFTSNYEIDRNKMKEDGVAHIPAMNNIGLVRSFIIKNEIGNIIWMTKNNGVDIENSENNAYKQEIKRIAKDKDIRILIDLAGLDFNREQMICISTNNFKNISEEEAKSIKEIFEKNMPNQRIEIDNPFSNSYELLIPTFAKNELGIKAMSIRANSKVFYDNDKLAQFCKGLSETTEYVKGKLQNENNGN